MDGLAEYQLTPGGGLQVVQADESADSSFVTLAVDDLSAHVAALAERGDIVEGDVGSFTQVSDPAGNVITLATDVRQLSPPER